MKMIQEVYSYDHYHSYERTTKRMIEEGLEAYQLYRENLSVINQLAYSYYYVGDYFKALDYTLKAHALRDIGPDKDEYYFTLKLTGDIYRKLSIHESAVNYYMKALKNIGPSDTKRKRCDVLRHMATVYTEINTLDLATDYGVEALQMAELFEDQGLIGDANLALCRIHLARRLNDKALKFGLKAVEMYKATNRQKGLVLVYLEIASIYANNNDYILAQNFYERALTISTEINFESGIIFSNYLLGKLLYRRGYARRAQAILEDALEISRRHNIQKHKVDLYYLLSDIYAGNEEFELAYNAYKTGTELNEHLRSDKHKEKIYKLQNEYNLYVKELQLKHYKEENMTLELKNRQLTQEVIRDPLTGLLNRRGLKNSIAGLSYGGNHIIILSDIDDFKFVNDEYGHPCGDVLLKGISRLLSMNSKSNYRVSRWGGEEFLMVLPSTTLEAGVEYAYDMLTKISNETFLYQEHKFNVTMTFGLAPLIGDFETSIHLADQRLYEGKGNGKNQVVYQ